MAVWVVIILALGLFLTFGSKFAIANDLIPALGIAITLICVGIGIRMDILRRRGEREKLAGRIAEAEEKIRRLKEQGEKILADEEKERR